MFGGKGQVHRVLPVRATNSSRSCASWKSSLGVQAFFVMDENFLLDRERALGLLEQMETHDKPWSLYVFSSANVLQKYTHRATGGAGGLVGVAGARGKGSQYTKLSRDRHRQFVENLRDHGIRVLGSSIIGLEEHTPENIDEAIEHAVSHDTEFHQFMLYTPIPGTPLFREHEADGSLKSLAEVSIADIHGQHVFNYHHPHIPAGQETEFLLRAFRRDFDVNGPSVVRIIRNVLRGWLKYKDHPNPRIRARFAHEAANLPVTYAGALWATREQYRENPQYVAEITALLEEIYDEFGAGARRAAPVAGKYLYRKLQEQQDLLESGWTYEPPTFYETNFAPGPAESVPVEGVLACPQGRSVSKSRGPHTQVQASRGSVSAPST